MRRLERVCVKVLICSRYQAYLKQPKSERA